MARINIYVTDDLKQRMESATDVNWSAVAGEAIERKLGALAAQREHKSMEDVIQRLRASKLMGDAQLIEKGRDYGYAWARDNAGLATFERLSAKRDELGKRWHSIFIRADRGAWAMLFGVLNDANAQSKKAALAFWSKIVPESSPDFRHTSDPDFVYGFAEGVLQLWEQVKDKL